VYLTPSSVLWPSKQRWRSVMRPLSRHQSGGVVFDDARRYGDGVNVVARLQVLAEPGGICLSEGIC